jgi:Flp pilus assembly protein TadD
MDDMTYRMAEGWLDGGRPLEALSMLTPRREELLETASGAMLLGRAYFKSAQLRKAEEVFRRAVDLGPTDSYARYLLGRTLARQSRHAEALPHLRLAAAQNPQYASDRDECQSRIA